jgi:predicted Zn-ribbon and HTH transcriptional regulator
MVRPPNESNGDARPETRTVRQSIAELLRSRELTAQEISKQASIPERDVAEHLRHIEHTLLQSGERLHVLSPHCVKCGFVFEQREKHGRPSRCPQCKSERLSKPRFSVVPHSRSPSNAPRSGR